MVRGEAFGHSSDKHEGISERGVAMTDQRRLETIPDEANRLRSLTFQVASIATAVLLYFGVRGRTEGAASEAVDHGLQLLRWEAMVGLDVESRLQGLILDNPWVVTAMNWVYIWGHWPVIAATLLWLYRSRRFEYLLLRNALFVSGAIGLVIFMLHPVAPPRLLPSGFVDTVTELSNSYRVLQPPSLVNKYAALPSLHVGWNLLVGLAVYRTNAGPAAKVFGVVSPLLMFAAVVLTGNHYVVDGLLGAAIAIVGMLVSVRLTPKLAVAGQRWIVGGHNRRRISSSTGPDRRLDEVLVLVEVADRSR